MARTHAWQGGIGAGLASIGDALEAVYGMKVQLAAKKAQMLYDASMTKAEWNKRQEATDAEHRFQIDKQATDFQNERSIRNQSALDSLKTAYFGKKLGDGYKFKDSSSLDQSMFSESDFELDKSNMDNMIIDEEFLKNQPDKMMRDAYAPFLGKPFRLAKDTVNMQVQALRAENSYSKGLQTQIQMGKNQAADDSRDSMQKLREAILGTYRDYLDPSKDQNIVALTSQLKDNRILLGATEDEDDKEALMKEDRIIKGNLADYIKGKQNVPFNKFVETKFPGYENLFNQQNGSGSVVPGVQDPSAGGNMFDDMLNNLKGGSQTDSTIVTAQPDTSARMKAVLDTVSNRQTLSELGNTLDNVKKTVPLGNWISNPDTLNSPEYRQSIMDYEKQQEGPSTFSGTVGNVLGAVLDPTNLAAAGAGKLYAQWSDARIAAAEAAAHAAQISRKMRPEDVTALKELGYEIRYPQDIVNALDSIRRQKLVLQNLGVTNQKMLPPSNTLYTPPQSIIPKSEAVQGTTNQMAKVLKMASDKKMSLAAKIDQELLLKLLDKSGTSRAGKQLSLDHAFSKYDQWKNLYDQKRYFYKD